MRRDRRSLPEQAADAGRQWQLEDLGGLRRVACAQIFTGNGRSNTRRMIGKRHTRARDLLPLLKRLQVHSERFPPDGVIATLGQNDEAGCRKANGGEAVQGCDGRSRSHIDRNTVCYPGVVVTPRAGACIVGIVEKFTVSATVKHLEACLVRCAPHPARHTDSRSGRTVARRGTPEIVPGRRVCAKTERVADRVIGKARCYHQPLPVVAYADSRTHCQIRVNTIGLHGTRNRLPVSQERHGLSVVGWTGRRVVVDIAVGALMHHHEAVIERDECGGGIGRGERNELGVALFLADKLVLGVESRLVDFVPEHVSRVIRGPDGYPRHVEVLSSTSAADADGFGWRISTRRAWQGAERCCIGCGSTKRQNSACERERCKGRPDVPDDFRFTNYVRCFHVRLRGESERCKHNHDA